MAGTYQAAPANPLPEQYEAGDDVDLDWETLTTKQKVSLILNDKPRLKKIFLAGAVVVSLIVMTQVVGWLVTSTTVGYFEAANRKAVTPWGFEWRDTEYVGNAGAAVYSDKELSSSRRLFMGRRLEDTARVDWLVGLSQNVTQASVDELLSRVADETNVTVAKTAKGQAVSVQIQAITLAEIKEVVKDIAGVLYAEEDLAGELVPDLGDALPFSLTDEVDEGGERLLAGDKILDLYTRAHEKRRLTDYETACEEQSYPSWGLDRIDNQEFTDHKFGCHAGGLGYGEGVSAYIIDTGIRYTHHDFEGRAQPALSYKSGSREVCRKDDFTCAHDDDGHGTHCAALVGGKEYGVAKKAKLYGVRVASADGAISMNWVCQSVDWILENKHGPTVISLSLQSTGNWLPILESLTRATDNGIAVVVAAGNQGNTDVPDACDYTPAFVPMAITVGSIDQGDYRSSFSNYGACIDIFAPGADIKSASHLSDDGSAKKSGTSQACPLVAGAAALLLGLLPNATVRQLTTLLTQGATKDKITDEKPGSPDLVLFVGRGIESLTDNPHLFELVGEDQNLACRGRNENDGTVFSELWASYFGVAAYDVEYTDTRNACETLCTQRDSCTGYEYKFQGNLYGGAGRCELWNRQIAATADHDGFECYRRLR